ncbi:MAG: aminotransferase class V-fold PLP-dependent enzyme [Chloroflexi bacterium]|nr:aminotransferase class V-fold PLP-dependent enzyme [Chloroflexota bacterium]
MSSDSERRIYEDLGVKPVINAQGNKTVLGGSRISPQVRTAMDLANRHYADMETLLKRSGAIIADMLQSEAALVTSGAAGAITLSTAACMAGSDPAKISRLPDTTGMKNEFLIQKVQRYKYDRCLTIFGGKMVEVGDEQGATVDQLRQAITERTAGLFYLAVGKRQGELALADVIRVAHQSGIPVIVDAAGQVYPIDELRRYTRLGADLVCYGAKYIGAPNSTGILVGRKALVDAAFLHTFVGFEAGNTRGVGRPLKVDRQEVVGVVAALRQWFNMDHTARMAGHERKIQVICRSLAGVPHIDATAIDDERGLSDAVRITLDEAALGKTTAQVDQALRDGNPSIYVNRTDNVLSVIVTQLADGEEQVVGERLRAALL